MDDKRKFILWADTELKRRNQLLDKYNKQQEQMIAELRRQVEQQQQRTTGLQAVLRSLNAEKFYLKTKCDTLAKQVAQLENRELDLLKQLAQSKQEEVDLTFGEQILQ